MKTIFRVLLSISLAANLWLFFNPAAADSAARSNTPDRNIPVAISRDQWFSDLETVTPEILHDRLSAAGMDDDTIRGVVEGVLRQRHADKIAELRIERARTAWWRTGRSAQADESALAKAMITEPLARLFGRDSLDVVDAESRYLFLAPEKRRLLAQIDLDYAELSARGSQVVANSPLQSEVNEQRLLVDERRKDVIAALTSAERAEYDQRYSGTGGVLSWRMEPMGGTEAEFRALKPLLDDFDQKSRALAKDENYQSAYTDMQRATMEQVIARLGYDRAMAFIWSGNDLAALNRAAQMSGLSPTVGGEVLQLATETGARAAQVHDDASLSIEQKRAALLALQETARAQVDRILPASAQQQLPPDGLPWLKALGEGRYYTAMPNLLSSPGYMVLSIITPPPAKRTVSPLILPRPPGG